jgi:ApaG protein
MQTSILSDTPATNASGGEPHGIRITPTAIYSAGDSDPGEPRYVFRYTILIANDGNQPAQLISRHWIIIDANGVREEVKGPGVVGETPRLEPGEKFEYQSFCLLKTPWGTMEGSYQMKRDDGQMFDAGIQRFYLRSK